MRVRWQRHRCAGLVPCVDRGIRRGGAGTDLGPDDARVATVAALCRRGYASRLVLSHDARCGGDIRPEKWLREWRYGHIPTTVVPALLAAGIAPAELELMLVRNPRTIFEGSSPTRET